MSTNYTNTPSFYTNEEYFTHYLGQTSYYVSLQNVVDKIVTFLHPTKVLELGSALGTTLQKLADAHPNVNFVGTDIREDMVKQATATLSNYSNCSFFVQDMCNTVMHSLKEYDLIFLLYSFHHIEDPLDKKITFLKNCYQNMNLSSYMLIVETFLPEGLSCLKEDPTISHLWNQRAVEGYASTYWASLPGLSTNDLEFAHKVAKTSKKEEAKAGKCVFHRKDEYLVPFSWLKTNAEQIGFKIVLAEPINCLEENAILLQKI